MKKLGLLPKLILAITIGIIIGCIKGENTFVTFIIRSLATFNQIFGNFLGFVIPLIIIGFVASGIGDLGKGAGKLLGITTILAYLSTLFAGSLAFFVDTTIFPSLLKGETLSKLASTKEPLAPFLNIEMPPIMGVMTALLMAFIIGIGISIVKTDAIKNVMKEFQIIVEGIIKNIIIPFLPLHIAGIFANMTYEGKAALVLKVFSKVFIVIILLHLTILLIQYIVAGSLNKANPIRLLLKMLPAYFTAIGTQSSAATIPVTLNQTKENGVNFGIAEFVVPLCATIHLSGSTITLVSCSIAIMMLHGTAITFPLMFGFIMMLGVTMIAAPGVPGGAVMAALGLLQTMLGFDKETVSLMIALYLAQDSFGTACNVTGDGAIALIMNKISGYKLNKKEKGIY